MSATYKVDCDELDIHEEYVSDTAAFRAVTGSSRMFGTVYFTLSSPGGKVDNYLRGRKVRRARSTK